MKKKYSLTGKVWKVAAAGGAWHFVGLPKDVSAKIRNTFKAQERGWGSHKVEVKIGKTLLHTSIFYDTRGVCFLLPLKASVRKSEGLSHGDAITYTLTLLL